MENDLYAAAAYYDYRTNKEKKDITFPRRLLIVDTDSYSAGYCECAENGTLKKVFEYTLTDGDDCVDDIDKVLSKQIGKEMDIYDVIGNHIDYFNHSLENYYRSDGQMDTSFKELTGFEIKCSTIETIFKVSEVKINRLLYSLEHLWRESGFGEDNTYIMFVGKSADLYPIVYFIKSHFSFDPFLSDERYVNDGYVDNPSQIVEIGQGLLEEAKRKAEEIFVCVYDSVSGEIVKQKLFLCDNEEDGYVEYFGPIFVSSKESIEFEVNSEKRKISLPYSLEPMDCDAVDVGIYIKDDTMFVNIRRFDYPTRIYEVPMVQ